MLRSCRPGESPAPAKVAPEDKDLASSSLDWRTVIDGAGLAGPEMSLAASAQVLVLTPTHVKLRIKSAAFAAGSIRESIARKLSQYMGHSVYLEFDVGDVSSYTVADQKREERDAARRELIETFKENTFVKEVVTMFNGVVDEDSVRPINNDN